MPLTNPGAKFKGVSNYYYDDVGHSRIDMSYSNPAINNGTSLPMCAHFSKTELMQSLTKQTAADVSNLNLLGGEGSYDIFDGVRCDRFYFTKLKKLLCDSMNDNLYVLKFVA